MRLCLVLAATVAAIVVLPSAAQAAVPLSDDYLDFISPNESPTSPIPRNTELQWRIGGCGGDGCDPNGNINEATTQANMGDSASTNEETSCARPAPLAGTPFIKTVWYWTFPDISGWLRVRVSGGDAVINAMPVATGGTAPDFNNDLCFDDPDDFANEEAFLGVVGGPGRRYAFQVGVYNDAPTNGNWATGQHLARITFFPDQDLDGTFDQNDPCPIEVGAPELNGCPDADGDGVADNSDRCPSQPGTAAFAGCADSDGDGIADPDDRCAGQVGPQGLGGCPDGDGDGVADIDDQCPNQNARRRDANADGCLDPLKPARLDRLVDSKLQVTRFIPGVGVLLRGLTVTGVPKGSRVVVRCKQGRKSCGRKTVRSARVARAAEGPKAKATRNIKVGVLKGKRLRFGAKIVIRVTRAGSFGKYIRYTVIRKNPGIKRTDRCTRPGQKKLRKKC